jgi:hypothetical protein
MVHILDLPAELLVHIFGFVAEDDLLAPNPMEFAKATDAKVKELADGEDEDEWEDEDEDEDDYDDDSDDRDPNEDLSKVCRVSRKFRDIAQPLLFRHFEDDDLLGGLTKTIAFTKALYLRPDLGKFVQDVSIVPIPLGPQDSEPITKEEITIFEAAIKDLQLGDQESIWITAMKSSELSVLSALLVNKTPNLRQLHLPGGQFLPKTFTPLFGRDPSFLCNLERFWIECEDEFEGYNIADYERFLTFPKLTFLTFERGDLTGARFPSTWTEGSLSTEEVAFHLCHIDADAIQKFARACKTLKSFIYQNFTLNSEEARGPSPGAPAEFNATQIQEALLLHKDTLENFHLEFSRDPWDIENVQGYLDTRVKIGSFGDFRALETIIIPHALLPQHPQFPHSLKKLQITDCNSSIRNMVQNIAKDCKNGLYPRFTDCRVLAIDITAPIKLPGQRVPPGKTPEQCFRGLQELFNQTTVDFQISPYKMPDLDEFDDLGLDEDDDDSEFQLPPRLGGSNGPMPQALLDMFMQRAMQDPDFAHLRGGR